MVDLGQEWSNVVADGHSVAAGRDVRFGRDAKVAMRDYHEYVGSIREDEPEWGKPPSGSNLVLCAGCRRRHISLYAHACSRCGYPQREMLQQHQAEVRAALAAESTRRKVYMLVCMLPAVLYSFQIEENLYYAFARAFVAGAVGHVILPVLIDFWRNPNNPG